MTNSNQRQKVETLRWRDDRLEMIDQRVLPAQFQYLGYDSAAAVAEGIRAMVVRGAPAIGCAAAYGVALEALRQRSVSREEFAAAMDKAFDVLAASRPTAVNLFWALKRMRAVWDGVRRNRSATSPRRCWPRPMKCSLKTSASTAPWALSAQPCCRTARAC